MDLTDIPTADLSAELRRRQSLSLEDDPEFQQVMEKLAEDCDCCPHCNMAPCEGCQQGSICDALRCDCEDYYVDEDSEEITR